jgi:prolyl-tRNA synthetase
MLDENTVPISTYEQLKERAAANAGFSRVWWCGDEACEEKVKAETHATIRCIPFEQPSGSGPCIVCGKDADTEVIMARAY